MRPFLLLAVNFDSKSLGHLVLAMPDAKFAFQVLKNIRSHELKHALKEFDSIYFPDFILLNVDEIRKPHVAGLKTKSKDAFNAKFVQTTVMEFVNCLQPFLYDSRFQQLFLVAQDSGLFHVLHEFFEDESFGVAVLAPDDYSEYMSSLVSLADIADEELQAIIKQLCEDQNIHFRQDLAQRIQYRPIDNKLVLESYVKRCERFLFIINLYLNHNGSARTAYDKKSESLNSYYDIDTLEIDSVICSQRKIIASRHDFQLIELMDLLLESKTDHFNTFLSDLLTIYKDGSGNKSRIAAKVLSSE